VGQIIYVGDRLRAYNTVENAVNGVGIFTAYHALKGVAKLRQSRLD